MPSRNWYNPVVGALLKSPLHSVMSGNTLLLTFTGRHSGRTYTTPISYSREGQTLRLISNRRRDWWRNLQGGVPVHVWLQGHELCGAAQVVEADAPAMLSAVQTVYRGIPPARAVQLAPEAVLIKIELN